MFKFYSRYVETTQLWNESNKNLLLPEIYQTFNRDFQALFSFNNGIFRFVNYNLKKKHWNNSIDNSIHISLRTSH